MRRKRDTGREREKKTEGRGPRILVDDKCRDGRQADEDHSPHHDLYVLYVLARLLYIQNMTQASYFAGVVMFTRD